jgi:uncharacterized surface protein with fasciclin (FAS1) repeats
LNLLNGVLIEMKFKILITSVLAATAFTATVNAEGHGSHDASAHEQKNIVEIAVANSNFETLVAAVTAAGLAETLQGDGPFTVFAPTDDAFAALPAGTLESLLKPENKDQLVAILTYHVIPGAVMAKDVVGLNEASTVQGTSITVTTNDSGVMVDGARVVTTDIEASNGVIHVIDKVLLPQS